VQYNISFVCNYWKEAIYHKLWIKKIHGLKLRADTQVYENLKTYFCFQETRAIDIVLATDKETATSFYRFV
jgi:hypothetical protein